MRRFLRVSRLWILALPFVLTFLGAGLNQLVLIANGDKFPVMINQKKLDKLTSDDDNDDSNFVPTSHLIEAVPADGMLDDVHCVMTKNTHLNFLADYLDFKVAIFSPGDLILMLSDYIEPYTPFLWAVLVIGALVRKEN